MFGCRLTKRGETVLASVVILTALLVAGFVGWIEGGMG